MEIHSIFENRRNAIAKLLAQKGGAMSIERKEQLQGAMVEIELILKTLEYYSLNGNKEDMGIHLMKNTDASQVDITRVNDLFKRRGGI